MRGLLFTLIIRSRNQTVLCGLKLLFGSIVLVDSAEAGYYFILFCLYITIEKYTIFQLKSIPVLIVCEDKKSYLNAG